MQPNNYPLVGVQITVDRDGTIRAIIATDLQLTEGVTLEEVTQHEEFPPQE